MRNRTSGCTTTCSWLIVDVSRLCRIAERMDFQWNFLKLARSPKITPCVGHKKLYTVQPGPRGDRAKQENEHQISDTMAFNSLLQNFILWTRYSAVISRERWQMLRFLSVSHSMSLLSSPPDRWPRPPCEHIQSLRWSS
jgi:hypothetical protein